MTSQPYHVGVGGEEVYNGKGECYDLSSELRLHLGKGLRREKGDSISGKV